MHVCSVHCRIFSTSGKYHEYIRGYPELTLEGEGFHEYIRQLYHEYIDIYHDSYQGMDIMSTLGVPGMFRGYHEYIPGYHEYIMVFSTR